VHHVLAIGQLIKSISNSSHNHAILIEGPPGFGKTTSVDRALEERGVRAVHLGAYSTPLNLYNFLFENSDKFVVIDDCAGLFIDSTSMAILKAATWPQGGKRTIRWGATSSRAATNEFDFTGKVIMVCNSFPSTPDGEAIKSRSFVRPITVTATEAKKLLREAAVDKGWYKNTKVAVAVSEFLAQRLTEQSVGKISYRTLHMGYELAKDHPENWQDLLMPAIPSGSEDPGQLVKSLAKKKMKVKDQLRVFEEITGLKRRSFFKYRSMANLGRADG
jgi:DNA polymerase III delta prime subunit